MARRHREHHDQRGSATVQTAIVGPALIVVLFICVQTGFWFHARNIAISAAHEGARAASGYDGSTGQGRDTASRFATRAGAKNVNVTAVRGAEITTVTVEVSAPNLLPWIIPIQPIRQVAQMPTERLTR